MRNRPLLLAVLLFVGAAGCKGAPEAPGFQSGTLLGTSCPPGTEAEGSCSDPDCGVPCVATTACESDAACPDGAKCASVEGDKWCMPKVCNAAADCGTGEVCQMHEFSKGVCLTAAR